MTGRHWGSRMALSSGWYYTGKCFVDPAGGQHPAPPPGWVENDDGCLVAWREFSKITQWRNVGGKPVPCLAAEPRPSITYELTCTLVENNPKLVSEYLGFVHTIFKRLNQRVFVCDPYHKSYEWRPNEECALTWMIPPVGIGEYELFVVENGRSGVFVHPWESSVLFWGGALMDIFATLPLPKLLTKCKVLRQLK
eukprot:TRINITY_DN13714_c0_g1_i1.p1 TRINITY_DN13714_c0_g1~~TRINITY_DN13714_c0_g1_i1.p1  ORF type:complete len:195 (+),score=8.29 TRINITY_DN13714_c0_g1_i1:79-663(+)